MYRKKIMLPAVTLLFILEMSLSACANKETPTTVSEESTVSTDSGSAADSPPADVSLADVSPADVSPADVSPTKAAPAKSAPADSAPADLPPADSSPQNAPPTDTASASEQAQPVAAAPQPGTASDTKNGRITEITDQSIKMSEIMTTELDDGSSIALSGPDAPVITVTFTDSTNFILRSVVNGGIHPADVSDREGSYTDLKLDTTVYVTGTTDSTGLCASEIVIYNFQ